MTSARALIAAEVFAEDPRVTLLSASPTAFERQAHAYQTDKLERRARVASTHSSRVVGGYTVKGRGGRRSDRGNVAVAEATLRLALGSNGWLVWSRLHLMTDKDGLLTATDEGIARGVHPMPALPLWRVKAGLARIRDAHLLETVHAQIPHYLPCGRVAPERRAELDQKLLRWADTHAWKAPLHVEQPEHAYVLVCVRRVYGHAASRVRQRGVLDGGARSCLVPAATAAWLSKASRWGGKRKPGKGKMLGRPPGAPSIKTGTQARKKRAEALAVFCLEAGRPPVPEEVTAAEIELADFTSARRRILRRRDRMRVCGLPPSPIADPRLSEPPKMPRPRRKQVDLELIKPDPRGEPTAPLSGISLLKEEKIPSSPGEPADEPATRGRSGSDPERGIRVDLGDADPFTGANAPPPLSNAEYKRRMLNAPWPDEHVIGKVLLPAPPVLDPLAPIGRRCEHLARAYRNAMEDRFPERGKCWILARGDVTRSRLFPLLKAASDFLTRERIAPATWAEWSITAWNAIRAKDGKDRIPPPIAFVFSAKRMAKHERWFAGTAPDMWKGRELLGPIAKGVVARYLAATKHAQRTGQPDAVMAHYFPEGYRAACAAALEESEARAEYLRSLVARGAFLWGDRFELKMPVRR